MDCTMVFFDRLKEENAFRDNLYRLRCDQSLTDLTIKCGSLERHVYRVVVSAHSEWFRAACTRGFKGSFPDNVAGPIDFSVALFALAKKYLVPSLQNFAFHQLIVLVNMWCSTTDFAAAVARVYGETVSNSSNRLHATMLEATLWRRDDVFAAPQGAHARFVDVANSCPAFCKDFLNMRSTNIAGREARVLWRESPRVYLSPDEHAEQDEVLGRRVRESGAVARIYYSLQCIFFPEDDETEILHADYRGDADDCIRILEEFGDTLQYTTFSHTNIDQLVTDIAALDNFAGDDEFAFRRRCAVLSAVYKKQVDAKDQALLDKAIERRMRAAVRGKWVSPGDEEDLSDADSGEEEGDGEEANILRLEELALV